MTTVVNMYVTKQRTKNSVYIGRPSKWGNMFVIGRHGSREMVIEKHREWLKTQPELVAAARRELKDKVLVCFCKPLPCHGDTWAFVADGGEL